jgi:hypothetical protein
MVKVLCAVAVATVLVFSGTLSFVQHAAGAHASAAAAEVQAPRGAFSARILADYSAGDLPAVAPQRVAVAGS